MIDYKIYDPNGNITVLVYGDVNKEDRLSVAAEIMKNEPTAEQTGFVSFEPGADITLNMAGGEFCGNATLCAGVFCYEKTGKADNIKVKVSGCDKILTVNVKKDGIGYIAQTDMPSPVSIENKLLIYDKESYEIPVVFFGGICHCIVNADFDRNKVSGAVKKWCKDFDSDALGVMIFDEKEMSVVPVVYVDGADTLFFENSCASGTAAIGCYLAKKYGREITEYIKQPTGKIGIDAHPDGRIYLTGSVFCGIR